MVKTFLAASAVALTLISSPAAASVGQGLSRDSSVFSQSAASVLTADFVQGHETVPLNLQQPRRIRSALEYAESARYDGFNTLVTLLMLLSATGVFAAASLATARKEDERLAQIARHGEAERGWKADVMLALEAELMSVDRIAIRRAA